MRSIALAIMLGTLLVLAAQDFARGDDEGAAPTPAATLAAVEARVAILEQETQYLRSREAALSAYVLANQKRAADMVGLVRTMRQLGFEAHKVPVDSRKALLRGLEALASSLQTDLPEVSKKEAALLQALAKAK